MAERTNARLLKSRETRVSVGSNPTPSAVVTSRDIEQTDVSRHRRPEIAWSSLRLAVAGAVEYKASEGWAVKSHDFDVAPVDEHRDPPISVSRADPDVV
jgi:hypothetical protein